MFRLYRQLEKGEFLVYGGDTAQGGIDANYGHFISKTKGDVPLVFKKQGVAASATPLIRNALNWVHDQTKVKPCVALERQNGGASEMHRLDDTNDGLYTIYYPYNEDGGRKDKPGWDTNEKTRAQMLGDWLKAFNNGLIRIYDQDTVEQHQTFITNKRGKPEADSNTHDDAVMSIAIAYQLFLTENPFVKPVRTRQPRKKVRLHL
ncbi:hypothetical protein KDA08_01035 [Candidatus Saccharibacteria bacterium]|nr:hypothetical protein [Candidatus Saccharibacteria bacterium]